MFEFINKEVIPGTNIKSDDFWNKFENVVHELASINKNLLIKREETQKKAAHEEGSGMNEEAYRMKEEMEHKRMDEGSKM